MRTITLEEHFATPEFLKATTPLVPAGRVNFVQAVESKLLDLGEGRIAEMDAAGIDMQVLSLTGNGIDNLDAPTATALVRDANDKLAAAVRVRPKRFAAFAALALQDPKGAVVEFERCIRKLGLRARLYTGRQRACSSMIRNSCPCLKRRRRSMSPFTCTPRRRQNQFSEPISADCQGNSVSFLPQRHGDGTSRPERTACG